MLNGQVRILASYYYITSDSYLFFSFIHELKIIKISFICKSYKIFQINIDIFKSRSHKLNNVCTCSQLAPIAVGRLFILLVFYYSHVAVKHTCCNNITQTRRSFINFSEKSFQRKRTAISGLLNLQRFNSWI